MDQPKIKRLLKLIALMSGARVYSIDELALRLDTSPRTIYRYIDTFKEAGFAVERIDDYKYRLVSVGQGASDISNLVFFSDEEAYIVNRLIDSLDSGNSLKAGLKQKLTAIYDSTSITQHIDNKNTARIVESLMEAMRSKRKVRILDYVSSYSGKTRSYLVEPFKFTSNFSDLWAYDLEEGRNKRFKLFRIGCVEVSEESWSCAYAHHDEPMDDFHCHGEEELHVVLKMNNTARNIMVEEYPLTESRIRSCEDKSSRQGQKWIYEGVCRSLWGIGRFVLGLQDSIEVLEGEELKEHLRKSAKQIVKRYGRKAS